MNSFLENAQQLFDVARADNKAEDLDFALLVRPDGGLHLIMESSAPFDSPVDYAEARVAYRVTRSGGGVRVQGKNGAQTCLLEDQGRSRVRKIPVVRELLRDRVLYSITSPLLNSASS